MMLSNSGLKCDFRGQNNLYNIINFFGNIQFEGLYSPFFMAPIVDKNNANWTLGCWKKIVNKFSTLPPEGGWGSPI